MIDAQLYELAFEVWELSTSWPEIVQFCFGVQYSKTFLCVFYAMSFTFRQVLGHGTTNIK
jgi:hypothetical protein